MFSQIPLNALNGFEKLSFYSRIARDYINMEAVFSDETENFVTPVCPSSSEPVTIRLRVAKDNVDRVFVVSNAGKNDVLKTELFQEELFQRQAKGLFDIYAATIDAITEKFEYYFLIYKNNAAYFYNKRGLYSDLDENFNFIIIPDFKTPEWAKGAVMYQIFVDRFCNGDISNDVAPNEYAYLGQAAMPVNGWHRLPVHLDIANFYGGDLRGVMNKIPYLKDLGVEVIYFCPIFVSPSNHKYDIQDYDYVDPHYGVIVKDGGEPLFFEKFHNKFATKYVRRTTDKENLEASNQLLCELISLAHEHGIKVILDGVFNHCGAFNKWMDKENFYSGNDGYANGAYFDEKSPYHSYFQWYDRNWPNNDCYDAWWGLDNHPKLNYEASPAPCEYMLNVGRKWVQTPFNADGWRMDVAADLGYSKEFNHKFWRDFRAAVRDANPDALILAEHYGDPKDWLQGDQWDTVMNYDAFMEPITWFLTGMEKHSEEFRGDMLCNARAFEEAMRYQMARFSIQSLQTAMNELSNHDHSRFLTRTNMQAGRLHTRGADAASQGVNKNIMMEAVTFQMTWPGAPTVYYGDEVSVAGWTDPDNRRTYPWGKEDRLMLTFHKAVIAIHKRYSALRTGSVEFLFTNYGILAFGRWNNENKLAVLLNNNKDERQLSIPVWRAEVDKNGVMERIMLTGNDGFSTETREFPVKNGLLNVTMPGFSSMILVEKQ